MAKVTSAIDKSIDNNICFHQLTPEVIRLYGDYSVSRYRAKIFFFY